MSGAQPQLQLRPLEASDVNHLAALFERLSPRSRYLRFFGPVPNLAPGTASRLAAIDHDAHEAVGAFDGDILVGAAHYFRSAEDPSRAEISVEVADPYQRHGLGPRLLGRLARSARLQGITHFTATTLYENAAVQSMIRHSGWTNTLRLDGPELLITMAIPPARPAAA